MNETIVYPVLTEVRVMVDDQMFVSGTVVAHCVDADGEVLHIVQVDDLFALTNQYGIDWEVKLLVVHPDNLERI